MIYDRMPDLLIRGMKNEELTFDTEGTAAECWVSENRDSLEGFFENDPAGCLIAEDQGQPVGICVATFYGKSGFIGELIVRPEVRGGGAGAELLNRGVQLLLARGVSRVFLDGG